MKAKHPNIQTTTTDTVAGTTDSILSTSNIVPGKKSGPPIDSGWGWVCVAALFIITMIVAGLVARSAGVIFVAIRDYYGATAAETSWVNAVMMALAFCLAPIGGFLSVRYGTRPVVVTAGLTMAIGLVASSFVRQVPLLYLTFSTFLGIGSAFSYVPALSHVGLYFVKRKTLASGIGLAGSGIGALTASPFTNYLLEEYGLPGAFLILGGVCLHICIAGMLLRPLSFYQSSKNFKRKSAANEMREIDFPIASYLNGAMHDNKVYCSNEHEVQLNSHLNKDYVKGNNDSKVIVDSKREVENSLSGIVKLHHFQSGAEVVEKEGDTRKELTKTGELRFDWSLLKLGHFWIVGVMFLLALMGFFNMAAILLPVHTTAIGLEPQDYALLTMLMGGFDMLGRVFVGWFGDLKLISKSFIFCITTAISGALVCVVPAVNDKIVVLGVLSSFFGFFGSWLPPLQAAVLVERLGATKLRSSLPLVQFLVGIPFLFSQPLAGYIFDTTGSWNIAFYINGGALIGGCLIMIIAILRYGTTNEEDVNVDKGAVSEVEDITSTHL